VIHWLIGRHQRLTVVHLLALQIVAGICANKPKCLSANPVQFHKRRSTTDRGTALIRKPILKTPNNITDATEVKSGLFREILTFVLWLEKKLETRRLGLVWLS